MTAPVPEAVEEDKEFPVQHLSILFSQKDSKELLQISKKANTPFWLGPKLYQKLKTDINFKMPDIDKDRLVERYANFQAELKANRWGGSEEEIK